MRLRVFLMLLGALLVAATFSFPYWQSVVQPSAAIVEIAFPGLPLDLQDEFVSLPPEMQAAYQEIRENNPQIAVEMVLAALAPRVALPEDETRTPNMTSPVVVASGTFQRLDAVRAGQGTLNIYQTADGDQIIRFDEGFSLNNGPDLRVYLSRAEAPTTPEEMQGEEGALEVGLLRNSFGAQNYTLPAGTNLAPFRSVVIYSPRLDMIYTIAPLFLRLS
jgi:hypothetical protein